MKKLLLLFFITITIFSGCESDSSPTISEEGQVFTFLQGKIEGWNFGSGKTLTFYTSSSALSKGNINSGGSFTLTCSKPSNKILRNITDSFVSPDITISDSSAMFNYAVLTICAGTNELGEAIQSDRKIAHLYYLEDAGSFMMEYWYFNKTTDINGYSDSREGYKTVRYYYNVHGLPGWNYIKKTLTQNTSESKTYRMESCLNPNSHYYFVPITAQSKLNGRGYDAYVKASK